MAARQPERPKADADTLRGVGDALHGAYGTAVPPDAGMRQSLSELRSSYRPDCAADCRMDQLLERLKRLPWETSGTRD